MSLQMSEHEICQMYRDAKDKNEQISILADLNVCDSGTIIDVLSRNGFVPGLPVKSKTAKNDSKKRKPATQFTAEICAEIEKLYAEGVLIREISERIGHDYIATKNKIIKMGLPKKYGHRRTGPKKKSTEDNINADKLYIQMLEETLKEKDEALKKVSTNCEAYKIELDKLMEENELLREQNKYREKFDTEVEALNDAIIMLDLLQVMARQESNSAVFSALFRANELISGVIKELL